MSFEIRTLRQQGFSDQEILSGVAGRAKFLRESGHTGEAVDAYLKGRPSPIRRPGDRSPIPDVEQMRQFQRQTTVSPEESRMAMRTWQPRSEADLSPGGLMRGLSEAALETASTFGREIREAPQQFTEGIKQIFRPGASALERALGGAMSVIAPVRGAFAPVTAVVEPTFRRGIEPMLPRVLQGDPVVRAIGETALSLPFGGMPRVTPAAELGTQAMMREQRVGEAAMRRIVRRGDRLTTEPEVVPPSPPDEPVSAIGSKVSTPEGPVTVVAQSPRGPIATETPADKAATVAANLEKQQDLAELPDVTELVQRGLLKFRRGKPVAGTAPREVVERSEQIVREQQTAKLTQALRGGTPTGELPDVSLVDEPVRRRLAAAARSILEETAPPTEREPRATFTPDQAKVVAVQALMRRNIPRERALQEVEKMPLDKMMLEAAVELRRFRRAEGEVTGLPGRPREPETPSGGRFISTPLVETMSPEELSKYFRETMTAVRFPEKPPEAPFPKIGLLRRFAEDKGLELQVKKVGEKSVVRLIGNGGKVRDFESLRESHSYLLTTRDAPKQHVEIKSPATGVSAFEAVAQGKQLTKEQRINLQKQGVLMQRAAPLEVRTSELPKTEQTQLVRPIDLREGAQVGTVEDLASRPEAMQVFSAARATGFGARMFRTPDGGYEVMFYSAEAPGREGGVAPTVTPDIGRAIALHNRVLQKGNDAVTPEEHRFLGRMFGIPEPQVEQFLRDYKPIAGGAGGRFEYPRSLVSLANRMSPERPAEGRIRIANPMAGGANSGSPLIRQATRDLINAETAYAERMPKVQEYVQGLERLGGGGKNTPASARAWSLRQGTARPANDNERQFLRQFNALLTDYEQRARAQGFLKDSQSFANAAKYPTDMDAVWAAFRQHFMDAQRYEMLDPTLRAKLDPKQFARFRDVFMRFPERGKVPAQTFRAVRNEVFDMSDVVTSPEGVPRFLRDALPNETYTQFVLPKAKLEHNKDFFQMLEKFVTDTEFKLQMVPVLNKYDPLVKSLPGAKNPFTERGFLEMQLNNAITHRPMWADRTMQQMVEWVNVKLGHEMFGLPDINAAAQIMRNAWFRGALGPDTALLHANQMLSTWMETGRLAGPLAKYIQKGATGVDVPGIFTEFGRVYGPGVRAERGWQQKALEWDRKLTQVVLSPHQFAENVTRGITGIAAMEEAIARGASSDKVLRAGFSAQSKIFPDLMMSQAQMKALEAAFRVERGFSPGSMAPLLFALGRNPLGRLSTMLLSFPGHITQFYVNQMRRGFSDAILKHEPSRLLRFAAFTGFWLGIPYLTDMVGVDTRRFFTQHIVRDIFGLPFYKFLSDLSNTVSGRTTDEGEKAWGRLKDSIGTTLIPQYRFGGKAKRSFENIERRYAVDQRGRFMYETTPFGEVLNVVGLPPTAAYNTRTLSRTLFNMSQEYRLEKRDAVDSLLNGDQSAAVGFMKKWGQQITPQDLQRHMQERMQTPAQRAVRGLPRELAERELITRQQMPLPAAR